MTLNEFYAENPERARSPEWDFGVMWTEGQHHWPRYRVSWVVETGEVYAVAQDTVTVLGVVPKVGEYPYSAGTDSWTAFKNEQEIERVMEGWAEQDTNDLSWVRERIASRVAP